LKKLLYKWTKNSGLRKKSLSKNLIESKVRRPELIDASAIIQYSELRGKIKVGARSMIHQCLMEGEIQIGSNTTINGPDTGFYCLNNPIKVGNFCSIARGTTIQEYNNDFKKTTTYFIQHKIFNQPYGTDVVSKGEIQIGHDVWIATGCTILSGVQIGNGAVIAANSVVHSDVPPFAIVGGSPAKFIKYRFEPEVIAWLEQLAWWNWPLEKIRRNAALFEGELTLQKIKSIQILD
jgi:acetyltransferase-like isoleucine patch superfamily enzyme